MNKKINESDPPEEPSLAQQILMTPAEADEPDTPEPTSPQPQSVDPADDKVFNISYVVIKSLIAKWKKTKEQLQAKMENKPAEAKEINDVINTVESAQETLNVAANKFKEAANQALQQYNKSLGAKGKLKKFFGFDDKEKQKNVKFKLEQGVFVLDPNGDLTIKQVTSPDFNISLFLENPKEAKQLIKQSIKYREILDPEYAQNKNIEKENLPTSKVFEEQFELQQEIGIKKHFAVTQPPILNIKEAYIQTLNKYRDICASLEENKKLSENARIKIANSYRKNPVVSLYYMLGENQYLETDKVMQTFDTKKLIFQDQKIYNFLIDKVLRDLQNNKASTRSYDTLNKEELLEAIKNKNFDELLAVFTSDQAKEREEEERKAKEDEERAKSEAEKERKDLIKKFENVLDRKLKELEKGIALFIPGETIDPFSDERGDTKIDPVYSESDSFVTKFFNDRSSTVKQELKTFLLTYTTGNKEKAWQTNLSSIMKKKQDFIAVLSVVDDLILARNKEAKRDLKMLSKYYDSKSPQKNTKVSLYAPTIKRNVAVKNRIEKILESSMEDILKEYKRWHDWMEKNKADMLKFFEENDGILEEKLIKLLTPMLKEKLKRKRNGKKNLRN